MNKFKLIYLFFTLCFAVLSCSSDDSPSGSEPTPINPEPEVTVFDPVAISKTNNTKVYVHYMPWFESKESSGNNQWGYHWTMSNQNPDNQDANGRREIASHYYPIIGPYHSGDKDVIENHLLMMKYAGIDGVLFDWYGTYDLNDYAMIKENTEQMIELLDDVGLEYAIVYEDRFLQNIVDAGLAITSVAAARTDMEYMESHYFNDSNYIHVNNQPLLLNFGPITLTTPSQWTDVFEILGSTPTFLTLWYESAEAGANAAGEYSWVYEDNSHIQNFYNNQVSGLNVAFGSAYPGFHDFYQEGGASTNIGWTIDHNSGVTMQETLNMAATSGIDYLQLVTWNDFGEGTMIEPTLEFGYEYLNQIKDFAQVQNSASVFVDISELFELRKANASNEAIQSQLDQAFYYFVSLQTSEAISILNSIE